jgi:CheY-like chemotaxis protein
VFLEVVPTMADILIVDDDEDLADTLAELLVGLGHDVHVARNGREGLSALDERELPDVILLDIEMPELDGPGMAYQMLVQDAGKERIPIVLISGYVSLRAIAERVGTPYFAPKPCSLDTLLGLLERALRERTPPVRRSPHQPTAGIAVPPREPSPLPADDPPPCREEPEAQVRTRVDPPSRGGK